MCNLQVDLVFPRTEEQMFLFASIVLSTVGGNVQELKVTGFNDSRHGLPLDPTLLKTLSSAVLDKINDCCPGLKTLCIRKCRFDLVPDFHAHLPDALEKLEFHECR
jgi:hypothetical protein